jgi:gliding motility-associated-like protein
MLITAQYDTIPPSGGSNVLTASGSSGAYEWFIGTATGTPIQTGTTTTYTVLSAAQTNQTTYVVRGTTGSPGNCTNTFSKTIYVRSLIGGSVVGDQSICEGATSASAFTSSAPASGGTNPVLGVFLYEWESSTTSNFSSPTSVGNGLTFTPSFTSGFSGTIFYRRKVTNLGVVAYSNTITLTMIAKPTVSASASSVLNNALASGAPIIPNGATITLLAGATGSNIGGGMSYVWSPSSGLSSTSGVSVQASPTTTTTYTVTGTTTAVPGCSNTAQITVTVNTLVPGGIEIGTTSVSGGGLSSITVCSGAAPTGKEIRTSSPVVSGGTIPYSYQWERSADQQTWVSITTSENTSSQQQTYQFNATFDALTAPRYYRRAVTNTGVTKYTSSVQVTVEALPNMLITAESDAIPPGGTNVLTASGSSGAYTWYIGSTTSAPQSNTTATFNIALNAQMGQTTYIVKGASLSGCENTFSKTILVVPITAGVIGTNQNICEGSTSVALLTSSVSASGGSGSSYGYQWKTKVGTGAWSTIVGATLETYQPTFPSGFTTTTQYVRVVTNKGINDSSNVVTYSYVSKPVITVAATGQPGSTVAIPRGATIQLNATAPAGQPIQTWSWSPTTALSATNSTTTSANPVTSTTYVVTGTSSSNCNATGQIIVNVSDLNSGFVVAASTSNAAESVCRGNYPGTFNQSVAASGGSGTYTYKWQRSSDNQIWQDITLNFNATANNANYEPGTNDTLRSLRYYRRVVIDMGVESASNAIVVSMLPNPAVSVSANKSTVPPGGSATLTATGGVSTYRWYNNQVQIGAAQSINVTVPSTSRYVAYTIGANGCGDSAALTLTTVALAEGSVGPNQTLCSGETPTTLNSVAPASGGSGTYTYTWQSTTDLNSAYTDIPNANQASYTPGNITTTTYFRRKVTDSGIDKFTALVSVSIVPNPVISASAANRYMPPSGTATLTANGASSYSWSPSVTSLNQSNSQVRVQGSGVGKTTYTALGVDNNNCQGSDTIEVYVRAIVTGVISTSQTVCEGVAPAILTGTASSGGSGVFTYQWQSSSDNLNFTNITGETSENLVFSSPATATTYYRRITTDQQVQAFSNTVTITVNPLPIVTVSTNATSNTICQGNSITLTALGASTYIWTIGTVQVGAQSVLTQSPSSTTAYTVVGTSAQGCQNSGTSTTVFVNPSPVLLASSNYTQVPPTAQVNLTATGATTYSWAPNIGLSAFNTASVTATPTSTIRYTVTGTASGCTDTSSVLIQVVPLNGGTIQTSKLVCQGDTLGTVRQISATSGGTGSGFNFEWEQSFDNITWTSIPNSNSPTVVLGSTTVLQSISLRRKSINLGVVAYSNVCVVQPISRPTVLVTPNKATVPIGGMVQLTASGAISYSFRNGLGIVGTTNPVSQQIFLNTAYSVIGTDVNGCVDTGFTNVQVQRLLPGTIGPAQTVCEGSSFNAVQNTGSPSGGSGSFTYQWQKSTDQLNWQDIPSAQQLNYSPGLQSATIYLRRKVSDSGVDTTTAVLAMVVNSRPNVRANSSIRVVPPGASITVTATGANTYVWSATNSTAFTSVGAASAAINSAPFTTTSYTVTGTNTTTSCQDTGVIEISVVPLIPGTISIASTSVCQGAVPGQMSSVSQPSGGSGSYTYQWQSSLDGVLWSNIGGAISPSFVPNATINATTFFRRQTIDMGVSESSNVLTINTISRPTILATTALPVIPPGATSTLQANGAGISGTYAWFVQGSQVSTSATISVTPSTTTSYILEGTNSQGCTNQDTLLVTVVPLDGGSISTSTNAVCIGNGGIVISSATSASGGSSVFLYSWERSSDNITFVQILGQSGASMNYNQALNTKTFFRRKTLDNGVSAYSNTLTVNVNPLPIVIANTATRRVPPGAVINLTGTGASTYSWTPASSFTSGATGTQVTATLFATSVLTVEGVDNATGCANTDTIQIIVTPLLGGQIGSDQFICSGAQASPFTSNSAASGGSGSYSYQWQQMLQGQTVFNDMQGATGTTLIPPVLQSTSSYRRKVTDMGIVAYSNEVMVTVSPVPPTPLATDTNYCQSSNLTVLVSTRVTADPGHTLRWYATGAGGQADANSPIYSAALVGVNDYFVSQVNTTTGCESVRRRVSITTRSLPNAPIVPADQYYCVGQVNAAPLSATLGSSANSLRWFDSDGSTRLTSAPTPNTSASLQKTYFVSETDIFGCTSPQAQTRAVVYRPDLNMVINQTVSCFGGSNGQLSVTATGGLTPYSYVWSKGGTVQAGAAQSTLAGQTTGVYQVRVEDGRGCFTTDSRTLSQPTDISIQVTPQNPQCFGDNGTITVLATGGTPGYQYSFDNGVTFQVGASKSLPFGSYRVKVKDANGCEKVFGANPIVLQQATAIAATVTATNVNCWGSSDGALTVNPSGGSPNIVNGTPVYQYLWNDDNLQTTRIASGLDSGTYTVTVYDQFGCNRSFVQQVGTPKLIKVTQVAKLDLTCFNNNSGRITVTASGGNVLSYQLNSTTPGGPNSSFTNLSAGEFTITVADSKGCFVDYQVSRTVQLAQPDQLIVESIKVDSVSCRNYSDGAIQIFASGGNLKKYSINNGISFVGTSTFANLTAGNYTVSVSDDKNCPATYLTGLTQAQVVGQPLQLVVSAITKTDLTCKNSLDGQIVVSASGGNAKLYSLSGSTNVQTSPTFNGLTAGTKTVTVSDVKSCPVTYNTSQNIVLLEPDSLLVQAITKTDVLCKNAQNGTISITATGGNVKTYKVVAASTVFQPPSLFNGLQPNTYEVSVRDSKLCTPKYLVSRNVTIIEPDQLIVESIKVDSVSCRNYSDGAIQISASGGNLKKYSINNGISFVGTSTFANLTAGNYTVSVSDDKNCPATYLTGLTQAQVVGQPLQLVVSAITKTDLTCKNSLDGQIVVSASGGNAKLYSLSGSTNVQTSPTFNGLTAGTKTVTVSDVKSCPVTYNTSQNIVLLEPDSLLVQAITKTDVLCKNAQNGTISITATGGNVKTYKVVAASTVFQNSSLFNGLQPNTYEVSVRDSKLCTPKYLVSRNVTVIEPDSLIIHELRVDDVTCKNFGDGEVEVTATGGNTKSYKIRNIAAPQSSPVFENLLPAGYFLTVSDNNNCQGFYKTPRSFNILEPDSLYVRSKLVAPVTCNGYSDGFLELFTAGGTQPHQYSLDFNGVITTQEVNRFNDLAPGTYSATLTDVNSCPSYTKTSLGFNIIEPAKIQVQSLQTNDVSCYNFGDGSVLFNAIGGNAPLEYSLFGDTTITQLGSIIDSLLPGSYTFQVSDSNSCPMELTPGLFAQFDIDQPDPLVIYEIVSNDISCHNFNDGSIVINAVGGNAPLRYSLNSGLVYGLNNVYNNLVDGIYSIKATDLNNCPVVNTPQSVTSYVVDITNPDPLASAITVVDALCHGSLDGSSEISITGGTLASGSSYQIAWRDANLNIVGFQELLDSMGSGMYTVEIRDDNQCLLQAQSFIGQPDSIKVVGISSKNSKCYRSQDGEIVVTATGGSGLLYSVDAGVNYQIPSIFSAMDTGIYSITITDANSCVSYPTGPFQVILTEPDSFYVSGSIIKNVDCFGNATGSILIEASGGNLLEYSINNGATWQLSPFFDSLVSGIYTLDVRDSAGCIGVSTISSSVNVSEPAVLLANATVLQGVKCEVERLGSAQVIPTGGTLPYKIAWETADTNFTALGLQGFEYEFTVTDSQLCVYEGLVKIPTTDADCDSIPDFDDGFDDFDGDGIPNFRDEDSDGDLLPDIIERDLNRDGIVYDDCDMDGFPDFLDVDYCTLFIPSVFTPNGDGANDNFIIPGVEEFEDNSLVIYDRNGNMVFSQAPYKNGFNGVTNGTAFFNSQDGFLPTGTYYYVLSIPSISVREIGYFYIQR